MLAEEQARGWQAKPVGSAKKERELGCDLVSTSPDGSLVERVEVKGWGEPLLSEKVLRAAPLPTDRLSPGVEARNASTLGPGPYVVSGTQRYSG